MGVIQLSLHVGERQASFLLRHLGIERVETTVRAETFLAALRAYPTLRPDSNVEAWLVTIAHRKAIDQARAAARRPITVDHLPDRPTLSEADRWDGDLWAALHALPLKQRAAVAYHYLAGLPYAEVAAIIGGSADAARRASADGIATLRKTYGEGRTR